MEAERALTTLMRHAARPSLWRRLAAASGVFLDRVEYSTLVRIEEAGAGGTARLTDLAELMGLDLSTVSRQVRNLEQAGLVRRSCDAQDQRVSRLHLTGAGQDTLNRARSARQDAMRKLLGAWTPEDRSALAALMGRLVRDMAAMASDQADGGAEPSGRTADHAGGPRPEPALPATAAAGRKP